jgi:hypothetical protein
MPRYIACYDLADTNPDPHSEFINQADKVGWKTWIWASSHSLWYKLPNTTLVGEFSSRDAAKAAFDKALAATKLENSGTDLEKYIIADYGSAVFDSDVTHKGS